MKNLNKQKDISFAWTISPSKEFSMKNRFYSGLHCSITKRDMCISQLITQINRKRTSQQLYIIVNSTL